MSREDQIRAECDALANLLIEKNRAYGDSALSPLRVFSRASAEEQILVRLDDKLSRLARGSAAGEDVILDLLGYLILLRIARRPETVPSPTKARGPGLAAFCDALRADRKAVCGSLGLDEGSPIEALCGTIDHYRDCGTELDNITAVLRETGGDFSGSISECVRERLARRGGNAYQREADRRRKVVAALCRRLNYSADETERALSAWSGDDIERIHGDE